MMDEEEEAPFQQALPLDLPYNEEEIERQISMGPPTTAEEYLLRVRYEAKRIPSLMLSSVNPRVFDHKQTAYMPSSQPVAPCEQCCSPSLPWQRLVVADFMALRESIESWTKPDRCAVPPSPPVVLPSLEDTQAWKRLCFGTGPAAAPHAMEPAAAAAPSCGSMASEDAPGPEPPTATSAAVPGCSVLPRVPAPLPPLLSVLTALDHVSAVTLLDRHVRRVCSQSQAALPRQYCLWMYGLLARTEIPLAPDTASSLRLLLKHCCRLRADHCLRAHRSVEQAPSGAAADAVSATLPCVPAPQCVVSTEPAAAQVTAAADPETAALSLQEGAAAVASDSASPADKPDELGVCADSCEPGQLKRARIEGPPCTASPELGLPSLNLLIVLLHRVFGQ